MKVLHVVIGLEAGGAELMLRRLVLEQRGSAEIDPVVVSLTELGPIGRELRDAGVEVRAMGLRGAANMVPVLWRLARTIRDVRPDIVQTWMYHADLLGGLAARLAGHRAIIWGIRNTDLFHGAGVSRSLLWIMRLCARLSSSIPRAIVCVAEAARTSHTAFGYAAGKMIVIPNGFADAPLASAEAKTDARRALGIAEDALVIGSVGRFNEYKDHRTFVRAMGEVAASVDASFLMVGRNLDDDNAELQRWIAQTGHPARFLLRGERSDVDRCFAAMDVFCLHSKSEGFPNVLAEAMLAGIPSVATDVGDARLLSDGAAILVPAEDPAALADATTALAVMPSPERERMGLAGRERIRATYSLSRIAARYADLYRRVIAHGPIAPAGH